MSKGRLNIKVREIPLLSVLGNLMMNRRRTGALHVLFIENSERESCPAFCKKVSIRKNNCPESTCCIMGDRIWQSQVAQVGDIKSRLCFSKLLLEIFLNTSNNSVAW